ncbi:MAG TPA: hypothetical protein VFG39_07450, partial [Balneolaceae bacterium]|nr:hypothetical protein [Balneolaceae bacterium]
RRGDDMPVQSRWMVRLSFIYLLTGVTLGAVMLVNKTFPLHPVIWLLLPVHIQLLIWGWIIQFTLGTAYWILPRLLEGPARGNPFLSWGIVLALNTGIPLNLVSIMLEVRLGETIGMLLQVIAVGLFVSLHWKRVTSYNK